MQQKIDKKQLIWAVPQIDKIILEWKIEQNQKQIDWLKSLLEKGVDYEQSNINGTPDA